MMEEFNHITALIRTEWPRALEGDQIAIDNILVLMDMLKFKLGV